MRVSLASATEHRHELPLGRAVLGGQRRTSLTQAVGEAARPADLAAAVLEPVPESVRRE